MNWQLLKPMAELGLLLVWAVSPSVVASEQELAGIEVIRDTCPECLIPGGTHVMPYQRPPAYLVCTSATRYFDDELQADLTRELNVSAKHQLLEFLAVDSDSPSSEESSEEIELVLEGGLSPDLTWWDRDEFCGLYFIPWNKIVRVPANAGETTSKRQPDEVDETPVLLLLRGRELRLSEKYEEATEIFKELRKLYPLTTEARRGLHEIYLVKSAKQRKFIEIKGRK